MPLSYAFEPGSEADGVTVDIPLSRLNQVNAAEFSWQVPGLRTELVTEMIRSLPKALRRDLVPAPDVAREVVARLGEPSGDLRDAVARELRPLRGVTVPRDAWDLTKLPRHLRITVRVTEGDRVLAEGKDVAELQRELRPRLRAVLSQAAADITRSGLTSWNFGALPRVFREDTVVAYPALADAGDRVDVRLFETEAAARAAMWAGTRRLILLGAPSPVKSIAGSLSTRAKLALSHNPHGSVAAMFADCASCAADYLMTEAGGPAWDADGFDRQHYKFTYAGKEFLGEVRCVIFDVDPLPGAGKGRFAGRIWVEDQDYHIVRFNGAFTGSNASSFYFNFDSWRSNSAKQSVRF